MKTKIIETIFPPVCGILAVFAVLALYNLIVRRGDAFSYPDRGFFNLVIPAATLILLIVQYTLALPLWKRFQLNQKVMGMGLIEFTTLVCLFSGMFFGFVFWEPGDGIGELLFITLTGVVAFAVYWAMNLLTLKWLEKYRN